MKIKSFFLLTICYVFSSYTFGNDYLISDYWQSFSKTDDYFIKEKNGFSGHYELDKDGVLISVYRDRGSQYNPMFSAKYAISACREFLETKDTLLLNKMDNQIVKLIEVAQKKEYQNNQFLVWEYDFDVEVYDLKAPWISGLAQARIAAAFICAYDVTKNEKYKNYAEMAMTAFVIPVEGGGVVTYTPHGVYFEEIAKPGFRSTKVLNGHISALQVVWLWAKLSHSEKYMHLAEKGINAVLNDLEKYDAGFLSWYDQDLTQKERHIAPRKDYNNLHVTQVAWLYHASMNPEFLKYALKFSGYEHPRLHFTTSHSTNSITHGPKQLDFLGYSHYWSSNNFPVNIDLDTGKINPISALTLWGYTDPSTPRDFDILGSQDGVTYSLLHGERGNSEKRYFHRFSENHNVQYLRIVIFSDNGNRNTAVTGIAFSGSYWKPQAISSRIRMTSRANLFFDEGFTLRADEWLLLDYKHDSRAFDIWEIENTDKNDALNFEGSNDLISFSKLEYQTLKIVSDNKKIIKVKNSHARYVRFSSPKAGVIVNQHKEANSR